MKIERTKNGFYLASHNGVVCIARTRIRALWELVKVLWRGR